MDHFGIDFETGALTVAADFDLPLRSGDVALFLGESGSGKSSLLRACAARLSEAAPVEAVDGERIEAALGSDQTLIDLFPGAVEDAMAAAEAGT